MSGRPPRTGEDYADGEDYNEYEEQADEEGAEYNNEGEGEHEENQEDEERDGDADDDDFSSRPASQEVEEFIPAPAEKPFPAAYVLDIGAIGTADGGNASRNLFAAQDDPRIPKWLHYILNDDFPSLSYLIHPPPGAELHLPPATTGGDRPNSADSSRPTSGRGGPTSATGSSSMGSESARNAGHGGAPQETPFHPNAKFVLAPSSEKPLTEWNLYAWDPPEPKSKRSHHRPGSAMSDDRSVMSSGAGGSEYDDGADSQHQHQDNGDQGGEGEERDAGEADSTVVVDAITLAGMFSREALSMLVRERLPALRDDGSSRINGVVDGGAGAGEDADLLMEEDEEEEEARRKRKVAPALSTFWKWCELYGGIYKDACTPLQALIRANSEYQAEPEPAKETKKKRRGGGGAADGKRANNNNNDEQEEYEDENEDDEGEDEGQEDELLQGGGKQTLAQKRRLFLDYTRLFDAILAAPSIAGAQHVEAAMRQMMSQANIAPSNPVDLAIKALRNINTLHAYVTFMECVPRSLVAPWTEPTPLTEAEVNAYPEGEDVPDEHPAKVPPLLWKFLQHIRRRVAKEGKGAPQPKRPLRAIVQKLFTPSQEDLINSGVDDTVVKPVPMIHSPSSHNNSGENHINTLDPMLTSNFDACRNYPPRQLRLYISDVVLVALCRHAFANDALEWLGEMKRTFPHPKWDPVGSSHVLALSLGRMPVPCALTTVSKLLEPAWFAPCGRVDWRSFVLDVASEPATRPLDTAAFRDGDVMKTFSKRFCDVFLDRIHSMNSTSDNNKEAGGAGTGGGSDVMQLCEAECPPLHAALSKVQTMTGHFESMITASANPVTEEIGHRLSEFESAVGVTHLATPRMLRAAVDKQQLSAVAWLVQRGVREVDHERGHVPVLEYCVESRNCVVLVDLIERYADVHAPLLGGTCDVMAAAQDSFSVEDVKRIEAAMRSAAAKRGADPTQLLGLRIGSIV